MRYTLEIGDLHGNAFAEEEYSRYDSDTPIPIPSPGDEIFLPGRMVTVVNRQFLFHPATEAQDVTFEVHVFCKEGDSATP